MPLTTEMLLIGSAIAIIAYLVFALSGFGVNLITMPLFAHFYPITFVVPMLALVDFPAAIRVATLARGHLLKNELVRLLPSTAAGMLCGVTLLVQLPSQLVLGALGAVIAVYGIYTLRAREPSFVLPRWAAIPCGFAGGVLSALFGVGGPVYVLYLSTRGHQIAQIRSTITTLLGFTTLGRMILFALYGLYAQEGIFLVAVTLAPAMLLGLYVGNRLHVRLSKARLVQCIAVLLIASGASLLNRAFS